MHGIGGRTGTLLTGIFVGTLGGAGLAEGTTMGQQLGVQFLGVIVTIVWCAATSFIILKLVDALVGLRVTEEEETEDLDIVLHEERGYNQ